MSAPMPKGPFCQSCSMPLNRPDDFGTGSHGFRINDYCRHCYDEGRFTQPAVTMTEMIDQCVRIMASQGIMPEAAARALLVEVMPKLKRWRQPVSTPAGAGRHSEGDEIC